LESFAQVALLFAPRARGTDKSRHYRIPGKPNVKPPAAFVATVRLRLAVQKPKPKTASRDLGRKPTRGSRCAICGCRLRNRMSAFRTLRVLERKKIAVHSRRIFG
jgi:hypothetical protein